MLSLTHQSVTQLEKAHQARSGRAAVTLFGGHQHGLRQTLIAIVAGEQLAEHANPGEATLQVLQGRVNLTWADGQQTVSAGEYLIIPDATHAVDALEDSILVLTVSVRLEAN